MSMNYSVNDIETYPDTRLWTPEVKKNKKTGEETESFPPYIAQRPICIAWCNFKQGSGGALVADHIDCGYYSYSADPVKLDEGERSLLLGWNEMMGHQRPNLVTWNGKRFDLPVLATRSFHHGVPMAWYYAERDYRYRYDETRHLDMMDALSAYGSWKGAKLDYYARAIGLPGKGAMEGSQVAGAFEKGDIEKIANYCLSDVAQSAFVFLRYALLRGQFAPGQLGLDTYRGAAGSLLTLMQQDERLIDLHGKIDEGKLLLTE